MCMPLHIHLFHLPSVLISAALPHNSESPLLRLTLPDSTLQLHLALC